MLPVQDEQRTITLGEVVLDEHLLDVDFKINEGYQSYSAELLRLALLTLSGLAVAWIKIYFPNKDSRRLDSTRLNLVKVWLIATFVLLVLSAATSLVHRYTAAESLAYHVTALRRLKRNRRSRKENEPSDHQLAKEAHKKRDRLFLASGRLLKTSACCLILGVVAFGVFMYCAMS
jgi:hypothetical protein